ncbi:MAG: hypothetical protein Q7T48_19000 [Cellvibrio sp.]|uniref:PepSY domain-containing protein n=1 Tax=Cellvibrio sp. TaxID=1965322 RepID=UPI00271A1931|nr:hypothetical protein [Cellvibrio sp.]
MLYSNTLCVRPRLFRQPFIMLATVLLSCQLSIAQTNDLIGGDLGLPSSETDNSLIDADDIAAPVTPKVSPAEAAELVRDKVGGQVMSIHTQQNDTGVIYGVKVLNAGRMRVINVDGETGQLLNH